ncbi:MAG TPA: AAA family ATPase [Segeticoccus sp.]|uniref:uridine kinase family protein n=1 Tax=Segeticoccus sp. TaxID=2706531 RepID=UPI002D809D10|nr:AAA family ATPase [Segeticoccus sp.]HET8602185.1 AAA family ATPase [Segeticoccus sp.]
MKDPGQSKVVVLCGPSGAGKSRLARRLSKRHGWPIVRLDDFYREVGDPDLPMLDQAMEGIPDWDDPRSWDRAAAVDALETLAWTGRVDVPDYDIATSRRVGHRPIEAPRGSWILAEGIFAAQVVEELRNHGLLAAACCVRNNRWLTFWRRLLRDLSEHRKPPLVLWRRGLRLARAEPQIVAEQRALGATPLTGHEAEALIERLAGCPTAPEHAATR